MTAASPPTPLVSGIVQIALASADPPKLARFYRETLGLELQFETAGMIFMSAGHVRLMIGGAQPGQAVGGDSVLYFEPLVWSAAESALERAGVQFAHAAVVLQRAEGRELALRAFKDPEGHNCALFGWRAA